MELFAFGAVTLLALVTVARLIVMQAQLSELGEQVADLRDRIERGCKR